MLQSHKLPQIGSGKFGENGPYYLKVASETATIGSRSQANRAYALKH
jgi:hypothetical protein